ncbi:MAG: dTDP-4-dehydrorhamnose reductase [Cyanobacteria bacterium]|nr:dTDP-4-dehydrorhamnose reductase [Cyanobacteriota bacterium]
MAFHKILVTGAQGMLGSELIPYLSAKGYEVVGTTSLDLNLLETLDSITHKLNQYQPEIIIHTAAYTQVDGAEENPDLAMAINKDGTQKLCLAAKRINAIFALISTDYVFDGLSQTPYHPKDRPNPINIYGLSKYYGELMVTELLEEYYIIRTSWLYGVKGKNFVQFVLESAKQGRDVKIIDDQVGSPTWTGSLCHLIEKIVTSGEYGTYHGSDFGQITRFDQAKMICKAAGLSAENIHPIHSEDFPQAANRPRYSVLNCEPLLVPSWETSLQAFLHQYFHPSEP